MSRSPPQTAKKEWLKDDTERKLKRNILRPSRQGKLMFDLYEGRSLILIALEMKTLALGDMNMLLRQLQATY